MAWEMKYKLQELILVYMQAYTLSTLVAQISQIRKYFIWTRHKPSHNANIQSTIVLFSCYMTWFDLCQTRLTCKIDIRYSTCKSNNTIQQMCGFKSSCLQQRTSISRQHTVIWQMYSDRDILTFSAICAYFQNYRL